VYATLSGNLDQVTKLPIIKGKFDDLLWIHYRVLRDALVDRELGVLQVDCQRESEWTFSFLLRVVTRRPFSPSLVQFVPQVWQVRA
jgi:hypothetical protein